MTSTLQEAVGNTVTVTLADGTEQIFRKISLDDWVDFGDWINIQLGRNPGAAVSPNELFEYAQTLKGMRRLMAMASDLDEDGLLSRFGSIEQCTDLVVAIMDQPSADEDEAAEGSDPPK